MTFARIFQILIFIPILVVLIGCATQGSMAFYKPEANQAEFVMDYNECHESARSKGMLKSEVPVTTFVWYEWLEGDRVNIFMTYEAQTTHLDRAVDKGKIFMSEYLPLVKQCMAEKGWIRKDYKQGDGAIYPMFSPTR